MKRVTAGLLAGLLCIALCAGCTEKPAPKSEKMQIVTTLFPYYDFARQIAGDCADVRLLLAPGREAHSFEPTPMDAVAVAEADVLIYNGGESEVWMDDLLDAAGEQIGTVLRVMDCVQAQEEEIVEGMQVRETAEEDSDEVEYDEHIWTSPRNAMLAAAAVCEALCTQDPANAETYRSNAATLKEDLSALDRAFCELRQSAKRDLLIFADRFPMLYFCREYDLRYRAAFHGCSSDTEPSLATLRYLIDKVTQENIPVVYTVDLDSQKIAEAVSECTGASVERLYSMQTVSREDFAAGETYCSLMERNLIALRKGLSA